MNQVPKLVAYEKAKASGLIQKTEHQLIHLCLVAHQNGNVYDVHLPYMREMMPKAKHQTLTSALSSLEDAGIISKYGTAEIEGELYSTFRFNATYAEQFLARSRRFEDKYKRWKKVGVKLGFFNRMKHEPKLNIPAPQTSLFNE